MSDLGKPPRRWKYSHIIALIIIGVCLCIAFRAAVGNGRYGGETPGRINDRLQTVRDIEDRADIRWAGTTADRWVDEDHEVCRKAHGNPKPYTRCMLRRQNTRILYMLRRGCTGVSTIASACKMEVK
jgi:hypothetical protein